ncbi:thermonuclease family protein [Sphingomonas sp. AP4-R1]|uniref:thermonuclease family protein n=1 Tax=Sphingomonas sp. AP4-R1 TaxID=2735134 RepID=UPI001493777C|nr:thermonuclease family protein [Sphingomonas sp. AP4-R1]QJU60771.1 thermonuclease family protein [Sphingomonas sp. AP4-R1]
MIGLFFVAATTLEGPIRVVDGDTIRAGSERIRLLGIDAPDDPHNGRCRPVPKPRAICDKARSSEATTSLRAAMTPRLEIERVGRDRYGRTLAIVWSTRANLSCWQLRRRQAVYHAEWDDGRRVARACPEVVR